MSDNNDEPAEAIENVMVYARDIQADARAAAYTQYGTELHLARSIVAALALMALGLYSKDRNERLFPLVWVNTHGVPDPDIVLALGFSQLANYSYAVIDLVEKGLDTPARALVRSVIELSQILVIIGYDNEAFRTYATEDPGGDKRKWYELFSTKRMAKRLAQVERQLGMPEFGITEMRLWRQQNLDFFSESVHHSYRALVAGGLPTIPGTNRVEIGLLGGPNQASGPTLQHLLLHMHMCAKGLFRILEEVHGLKANFPEANCWWAGRRIYSSVEPDIEHWIHQLHV